MFFSSLGHLHHQHNCSSHSFPIDFRQFGVPFHFPPRLAMDGGSRPCVADQRWTHQRHGLRRLRRRREGPRAPELGFSPPGNLGLDFYI